MKQRGAKAKNGAGRPYMASVMGICGGMVGPKSRNVEKALALNALFKGSGEPRVSQGK